MTNKTKNHYEAINDTAEEILKDLEVTSQEKYDELEDEITTRVHEESDNAVIYCHNCDDILESTNNDEAYEDVDIELTGSFQDIKTQVAYWAYNQDLNEALRELYDDLPIDDEDEEDDEL